MKDFLGSDSEFACRMERRPFCSRVADCRDEKMVRREFAADGVSRERGVISRAGAPISDASTTRVGNWSAVGTKPKFLTGSDGILLIRQEIIQSSISNYWQQGEQRIGLGLQRSRLWHLLKAWGGVFRFQPIGHACSTG